MQSRARRVRSVSMLAVVVIGSALLAGCAGGDKPKEKAEPASASEPIQSVLVIDGKEVVDDTQLGDGEEPDRVDPRTASSARDVADPDDEWPEPELNADGTIDDGDDPFNRGPLQPQALQIEDDARTTEAIDLWRQGLRSVDIADYNDWMQRGTQPWSQDPDAMMQHVVKLMVERCGGAETVATGVVLSDETVVTTVHAIESIQRRVRVAPALGNATAIPAMVRYLDVDDDIAVLYVPGLRTQPMPIFNATRSRPQFGYAYGVGIGRTTGMLQRTPVVADVNESVIDVEQPDGFAEQISDRSVYPMIGAVSTGFTGGVVTLTNDADFTTGWGFHGLIRARVPFRAETAGILVPSRLVEAALDASDALPQWFEHRPGGCQQWHR